MYGLPWAKGAAAWPTSSPSLCRRSWRSRSEVGPSKARVRSDGTRGPRPSTEALGGARERLAGWGGLEDRCLWRRRRRDDGVADEVSNRGRDHGERVGALGPADVRSVPVLPQYVRLVRCHEAIGRSGVDEPAIGGNDARHGRRGDHGVQRLDPLTEEVVLFQRASKRGVAGEGRHQRPMDRCRRHAGDDAVEVVVQSGQQGRRVAPEGHAVHGDGRPSPFPDPRQAAPHVPDDLGQAVDVGDTVEGDDIGTGRTGVLPGSVQRQHRCQHVEPEITVELERVEHDQVDRAPHPYTVEEHQPWPGASSVFQDVCVASAVRLHRQPSFATGHAASWLVAAVERQQLVAEAAEVAWLELESSGRVRALVVRSGIFEPSVGGEERQRLVHLLADAMQHLVVPHPRVGRGQGEEHQLLGEHRRQPTERRSGHGHLRILPARLHGAAQRRGGERARSCRGTERLRRGQEISHVLEALPWFVPGFGQWIVRSVIRVTRATERQLWVRA